MQSTKPPSTPGRMTTRTTITTFESLTGISPHTILRLAVIIGGYILIRPLIELCFRRLFSTQQEQQESIPPTSVHGGRLEKTLADEFVNGDADLPAEKESSSQRNGASEDGKEGNSAVTGVVAREWGNAARRRQAKFMEYWEAEQARKLEEDDLADIADLLEDG